MPSATPHQTPAKKAKAAPTPTKSVAQQLLAGAAPSTPAVPSGDAAETDVFLADYPTRDIAADDELPAAEYMEDEPEDPEEQAKQKLMCKVHTEWLARRAPKGHDKKATNAWIKSLKLDPEDRASFDAFVTLVTKMYKKLSMEEMETIKTRVVQMGLPLSMASNFTDLDLARVAAVAAWRTE